MSKVADTFRQLLVLIDQKALDILFNISNLPYEKFTCLCMLGLKNPDWGIL